GQSSLQPWGDNQLHQSSTYPNARSQRPRLCPQPGRMTRKPSVLAWTTRNATSLLTAASGSARMQAAAAQEVTADDAGLVVERQRLRRRSSTALASRNREPRPSASETVSRQAELFYALNLIRRQELAVHTAVRIQTLCTSDHFYCRKFHKCISMDQVVRRGYATATSATTETEAGLHEASRPSRGGAGKRVSRMTGWPIDESKVPAGDAKLADLLQAKTLVAAPARTTTRARIEIRLFNQARPRSAYDVLNAAMADVICQQLGYPGQRAAHLKCLQQFGRGNGGFILSGVHCQPGSKKHTDCAHGLGRQRRLQLSKNVAGPHLLIGQGHARGPRLHSSLPFLVENVRTVSTDCSRRWDEPTCDILNVTLSPQQNGGCRGDLPRRASQGVVCDDHFSDEEVKVVCATWHPRQGALAQRGQFSTPAGVVMWLQDIRWRGHRGLAVRLQPQRLGRVHLLDR
uniref:SRCR domain-containing protein n=1 Tax=Macrostomum lignano TaxID=282301 RepID=A0A1I8FG22_9PLAT